ncbi:aminotransferase class IV [Thermobrachium celere]|uniref:aminotransferase class IV n=1 Tax=Thermobrachium celere TaxID=53422 RepID=UPI0019445A28|nr:aminotransferase class IV [Thermobrachium celere]GFR34668.1 branched chain amino acid aminotransferase [Thermobrachium celere]
MGEAVLKYFLHNGKEYEVNNFDIIYKELSPSIYEVIRLINGKPVFLEDHIERLNNSAKLLGVNYSADLNEMKRQIVHLANINNIQNYNVKIVVNNFNDPNVYLFFIKSIYPTEYDYENGVKTTLYKATRENPNAKVINSQLREKINNYLKENNLYEAILVNNNDEITEGSRSNIFFIKNNTLYTAPKEDVLVGITRIKVIEIAKNLGFEVVERKIKVDQINDFEACFLTGTSPKVLPISHIDDKAFNVKNPVLKKIMAEYDKKCHPSEM